MRALVVSAGLLRLYWQIGRGASGLPEVFHCQGAITRYRTGTGRQVGADLKGEVEEPRVAGQLLQALRDDCDVNFPAMRLG